MARCGPEQKPLVLVTHDESIFNAYGVKQRLWQQPPRPKARWNSLMVSDSLAPGGRLAIPDTIPDAELTARPLPRRYAIAMPNIGTVGHPVKVAVPIFNTAFPGCQAMFAPDNACNHSEYALRSENITPPPHPGRKQSMLREGFMHGKGLPQPISFLVEYHNHELARSRVAVSKNIG